MATTKWAVYSTDLITRDTAFPFVETLVSIHDSASDAMGEANRLKREDRSKSYIVGEAQ